MVAIEISPLVLTITGGDEYYYKATGVFENATADITASVTWDTSNSDYAIFVQPAGHLISNPVTPSTVTLEVSAVNGVYAASGSLSVLAGPLASSSATPTPPPSASGGSGGPASAGTREPKRTSGGPGKWPKRARLF